MSGQPEPARLNVARLERHALNAIADRLGKPFPSALLSITRDGSSVILRLNSGGNGIAAEHWFRRRGYTVTWEPRDNDYGCAIRVTTRQEHLTEPEAAAS